MQIRGSGLSEVTLPKDNGAYFNRLPMPPRLDHIRLFYVDYLHTYFLISTYLIFVNFDISI
jgi:hypothetical protein